MLNNFYFVLISILNLIFIINNVNSAKIVENQTSLPTTDDTIDNVNNDGQNLDLINYYNMSTAMESVEIDKFNLTSTEEEDYEIINFGPKLRQQFAKQIGLPSNPVGMLVGRIPCTCQAGVCGCCTGFLLSAFRSKGCMNLTYIPEDFAFEVKMVMNDAVLYKNKMSGRNPRPICVNPPRFTFIELCANFYDIYFIGRNMHICLEMDANFQGYELFNRSFDCMRLGDQGVHLVKPEDGGGLPHKPSVAGIDADIDAGGEDVEDYDENLIRTLSLETLS